MPVCATWTDEIAVFKVYAVYEFNVLSAISFASHWWGPEAEPYLQSTPAKALKLCCSDQPIRRVSYSPCAI